MTRTAAAASSDVHDGDPEGRNHEEPLAEAVFRSLLGKIYDGKLAAGALINEAALAGEYRTSRGPVREAVRRLQGYRLVTREPYQRARVVELTPDFVRQLFEMRMALEGMACNLAASRISLAEIDRIARELDAQRAAPSSRTKGRSRARTFDFHESIVRACGNERIAATLCDDLYHLLRIYRGRSGAMPDRHRQAHEEHWQILRALKARDGPLAESLMRAHIGRANSILLQSSAGPSPA
ncbi:MAG: GntR family transcriptional regulator [Burkholderiales bacterium]